MLIAAGVMVFLASPVSAEQRENPFIKPELSVSTSDLEDFDGKSGMSKDALLDNLYGSSQDSINGNLLMGTENEFFSKGYSYKGTINGVDIYYNPTKKHYIKDSNKILTVGELNTTLPSVEKINY